MPEIREYVEQKMKESKLIQQTKKLNRKVQQLHISEKENIYLHILVVQVAFSSVEMKRWMGLSRSKSGLRQPAAGVAIVPTQVAPPEMNRALEMTGSR